MRALSAIVASAAAGYLWAAAFGDGVHGLKGATALDNSSSFPDANVVFLIALGLYGASPFFAARCANRLLTGDTLLKWFGVTAGAGAALFALSRLFL